MIHPHFRFEGSLADCAPWIPVARKLARFLFDARVSGVRRLSESVWIIVENRFAAKTSLVTIIAGGKELLYQFLGTEGIVYQDFPDPRIDGRYLVRTHACLVKMVRRKNEDGDFELRFLPKPLCSSLTEPSDEDSWKYVEDPNLTDQSLYVRPIHQPDGSDCTKWYGKFGNLAVTTWGQSKPHYGVGHFSAACNGRYEVFDSGYDFAPTVFTKKKGAVQAPDSDWYREAGICKVVSEEYGTRNFVIMVDVQHKFYCYPKSQQVERFENEDPSVKWNVPDYLIKIVDCPWPDWVSTMRTEQSEIRAKWAFNSIGTRAACVAYHRASAWGNSTIPTGGDGIPVQEDYPGMVEVEFTIAITGDLPEAFSFDVALRSEINPFTAVHIPVAVGYLNKPITGAARDSMTLLCYKHSIGYFTFKHPIIYAGLDDYDSILRRPVIATVAEVFAITESDEWIEMRRWLACYNNISPNFRDQSNTRWVGEDWISDRPFYPRADDMPGTDLHWAQMDEQVFVTQLCSIDLNTLSFVLCSTLTQIACNYPYLGMVKNLQDSTTRIQMGAAVHVFVYNEERVDDYRYVGAAWLEEPINNYFWLVGAFPDFDELQEFTTSATISYEWDNRVIGTVTYYFGETMGQEVISDVYHVMVVLRSTDQQFVPPYGEVQYGFNLSAYDPPEWRFIYAPAVYFYFDDGLLKRDHWVGTNEWEPLEEDIQWDGNGSFDGYPFGAIWHNRVLKMTDTAMNNVRGKITVHPSGSYSLFAGPFAAATNITTMTIDGETLATGVTISNYTQEIIDIVYGRMNQRKENPEDVDTLDLEHSTTHLNIMNECFKTELTDDNYLMDLSVSSNELHFVPKCVWGDIDFGFFTTALSPVLLNNGSHSYGTTPIMPISLYDTLGTTLPWMVTEYCFDPDYVTGVYFNQYFVSSHTFPSPRIESVFIQEK